MAPFKRNGRGKGKTVAGRGVGTLTQTWLTDVRQPRQLSQDM
ncbi:unnamed protein product [Rhodiola kirilowii]